MNLISAVSPCGELRFKVTKSRVRATVFIEFLTRLLHDLPGVLVVIVDRHLAHKTKRVTQFVDSVAPWLHTFYFPPYSPELNPDEWVWNDLKNNGIGRKVVSGGPRDLDRKQGSLSDTLPGSRYAASRWGSRAQ